jgi:hypothetical protein
MIKASITLQKGSQLLAKAVDPKNILIAQKYIFSAMNPKVTIRSA